MKNKTLFFRYSYIWVTLGLFLGSSIGHWTFAWFTFVNEQQAHGQLAVFSEYLVEVSRDTFKNWRSEFLQLPWQVGGLTFLYCLNSPQSREGDDRKEEKLDKILAAGNPDNATKILKALDEKYPRK